MRSMQPRSEPKISLRERKEPENGKQIHHIYVYIYRGIKGLDR